MIIIMPPLQSVQMPIIKKKKFCSPLTALPKHYLMLHRHWRINILRRQKANNHILIVLHGIGTNIHLFAWQLEEYSNEAHLSAVMAAIQYSKTLTDTNHQNQDEFPPDFEGKDDDAYSLLQNLTKAPIILNDFLRALPHCPIIHWASQMCNNPKLCFYPFSIYSRPWRKKYKIFINDDHKCNFTAMTPQELLKQLKNEGDYTHTAISLYLETLDTFS
jgi:hypothetical protein